MRSSLWAAALLVVALGLACTKENPRYCETCVDKDKSKGPRDAGPDGDASQKGDASDASDADDAADVAADGPADLADALMDLLPERPTCSLMSCAEATPICDVDAGTCGRCTSGSECKARDATKPGCDPTDGKCYPCATNAECAAAAPICDAHLCRHCKADSECGGPGVCAEDGTCATDAQIFYVDFNPSGCAGADGSSAKPFCNPSDAVPGITAGRSIIVIRGPASGQLSIGTAVAPVTVLGRKNAAGLAASIPLGVFTGVAVSAGHVVIRDLSFAGGTGPSAKGVAVSGATSSATLRRLTIETGSGLGAQADTGASITVDQSILRNNQVGGLLVNGASYTVTNTVFDTNGYGVKFNLPKTPSLFVSNTIIGSVGSSVSCDPDNPQTLTGSIIVGVNDSCTVTDSLTTAPAFDASRYHLTAPAPCPMGDPSMAPAYDIDGDPRPAGHVDCGADQFK
ncbi:MAG TPA: right-handed parallel beta-helix repeat-containing protein [Polyangia bacterium]|nr:right-handed parallel beta-helix repeat-containing protein [Polyangia bacterium]